MNDPNIPQQALDLLTEAAEKQREDFVKKNYRRLQLVTPDLFSKYLSEKGVSDRCLACGHHALTTPETMGFDSSRSSTPSKKTSEMTGEELNIYTAEAAVNYVTPSIIDSNRSGMVSNYQYRMICQNCGHISYFRAANVVYWVEDLLGISEDLS